MVFSLHSPLSTLHSKNASARTRTRNSTFEASHDVHFTTEANAMNCVGEESNLHSNAGALQALGLADAQPTRVLVARGEWRETIACNFVSLATLHSPLALISGRLDSNQRIPAPEAGGLASLPHPGNKTKKARRR